jgi:hypothetical protein
VHMNDGWFMLAGAARNEMEKRAELMSGIEME